MRLDFVKMHGAGNDYIYFDCFRQSMPKSFSDLAIKLSDRHKGVGADGIVLIMESTIADCRMRMFNADGSEGRMCGNAIRCVGKYVRERGIVTTDFLSVETLSGVKHLHLDMHDNKVIAASVDMGKASVCPEQIPMLADVPLIGSDIEVEGNIYCATAISMGNPHLVVDSVDVDCLDLQRIGPSFEHHHLFPDRINTEFVEILSDRELKMRVWERGSGETMACGTGACAVVASYAMRGLVPIGEPVMVHLKGGDLRITYNTDTSVVMYGPAEEVFIGSIDYQL